MKTSNIGEWLNQAITEVKDKTEFPLIEIHSIASCILEKPREWIIAHPESKINESQIDQLDSAVDRLLLGEPLAYITGHRAFYGLDFYVDRNVLIPRPETEILVEEVINWFEDHPDRRSLADVGTGSGVIAITCADRFLDLRVVAIDSSMDALDIARKNAESHNALKRITFHQSNLLEGCERKFDVIAANLPYIPTADLESLDVVKFEPRQALDGGSDGLDFITQLLTQSPKNMLPGGCLFLEIQYNQLNVHAIAKRVYPQASVTIIKDLASLPRVIRIQL